MTDPAPLSRRRFVLAGAVAAVLGACGRGRGRRDRDIAGHGRDRHHHAGGGDDDAAAAGPARSGTLPPTSATGPLGPARYVPNGDRAARVWRSPSTPPVTPPWRSELLDVIARAGVPITVFGVGQWMAAHPELVDRIAHDGHELANHTLTHQAMGQLSADRSARRSSGARTSCGT
jgi:hypothetical protein